MVVLREGMCPGLDEDLLRDLRAADIKTGEFVGQCVRFSLITDKLSITHLISWFQWRTWFHQTLRALLRNVLYPIRYVYFNPNHRSLKTRDSDPYKSALSVSSLPNILLQFNRGAASKLSLSQQFI